MDTLESLLDTWEKDCNIDKLEPGKELLNIPKLHSKYLKVWTKTKLQLKKVRNEYADAKKTKWSYYNGHYNTDTEKLKELDLPPFKFILKADVNLYLESDKDLIKYTDRITYYEEMAKALEAILGELKQRTWQLKEFAGWEKFIAGA